MKMKTLVDVIRHPKELLTKVNYRYPKLFSWMNDEQCIKFWYKYNFGKELDIENPKTFNEKIQWLKLNDRNPLYTNLVDKYEVKKYVEKIIGSDYIIPTIGVWDTFDEINFDKLPNQFVLKCTHDSGGLVICKNKSSFNKKAAKKKIERSLKRDFYWVGREWPYKNIKPRIIAEKYMEDTITKELRDYKFFTFSGKSKILFIASNRMTQDGDTKFDFFDMGFNHLDIENGHPNSNQIITCPSQFEKMKELSELLSEGIPQLRVDFYEVNGHIYFGELTFAHWSGFVPFKPDEWDIKLGEWIILPI